MSFGLRNARIDLIRGVSIFLVLFHHFNIAYHLNDTTLASVLGWDAVRAVARNGNYGVTMFFVISGYLITSNANRRWPGLVGMSAWAFYGLRIARIVPCLLLLILTINVLALAGVTIFQNTPSTATPVSFWTVNLASLTFWMNVLISARGWVNYPLGVLWSLSVEEVFYLSFPMLCLALRRESLLLAFWGVIIIVGPFYRFAHQGDEEGFLYDYFACFDGIAIGCCTALLAKRMPMRGLVAKGLQALTLAAMTFLYLYWPIGQANVLGVTAMALGTAVLLLGAHHRPSDLVRQRTRLLVGLGWFGRLSYELYLFHLIVLGAMRTIFPPSVVVGNEKILLLAVFFLLSAALSAAVGRFYAEPLNRSIRRFVARRTVNVTV
ncbi:MULTISPECIES: acyltransferase family protein [Pseudomonas]|jgi:peptidoglycan/LPS O-acetylase OafA/YrhL|uniref:Acyltransferase n=1 Tax=Pseudomonas gingeri TaxID=117681 RepID=A0A7Y7WEE4_9PSED|nr:MULTISPECIES: acyltransferase [Pseudomonas]MCU1740768.1 acyltransferase [Pseudomonas sp. 20S_6.2_Bac1]NWB47853.1 acyltransferase [Pseudomonas gingeri]